MEVQPLDSLEYLDTQDFDDMWNFNERLTLRISKCGFLIRQFLQLEHPWSLDNTKLDPFAERVPASLVQDETVDELTLTSSTSGYLDMGIGEDESFSLNSSFNETITNYFLNLTG
ncbi:hypothetical protein RCL_jg1900.t1 [Rhizophagus clarus]|uniref:Uncharacterized protein n=1 Tax=Rhizophagus clarus TaxID=94130 RepID=A0A8H3LWL0_9GLOM|nr:hypothetical protein RCL_jg1900.t1 [Rhizophagus clarus]